MSTQQSPPSSHLEQAIRRLFPSPIPASKGKPAKAPAGKSVLQAAGIKPKKLSPIEQVQGLLDVHLPGATAETGKDGRMRFVMPDGTRLNWNEKGSPGTDRITQLAAWARREGHDKRPGLPSSKQIAGTGSDLGERAVRSVGELDTARLHGAAAKIKYEPRQYVEKVKNPHTGKIETVKQDRPFTDEDFDAIFALFDQEARKTGKPAKRLGLFDGPPPSKRLGLFDGPPPADAGPVKANISSAELIGRGGSAPLHDRLRATPGSLEHAMADFDQKNPGAAQAYRDSVKSNLRAYMDGKFGASKRLQLALRGHGSVYEAFQIDHPAYLKRASNEEDVREARGLIHEGVKALAAAPFEKLPGAKATVPTARAVAGFLAGAADPLGYPEQFEQFMADPERFASGVASLYGAIADPKADPETRITSALTWATTFLPLAGKFRGVPGKRPSAMPHGLPMDHMTNLADAALVASGKSSKGKAVSAVSPKGKASPGEMPGYVKLVNPHTGEVEFASKRGRLSGRELDAEFDRMDREHGADVAEGFADTAVSRVMRRMVADGFPADEATAKRAAQFVQEAGGDGGKAVARYLREPLPEDYLIHLEAGFDLKSAIKRLDRVDVTAAQLGRPDAEGFFMTDRGERKPDFGLLDRFVQPLTIFDHDGTPLQKGSYSRIGGKAGDEASATIRNAERQMTAYSARWRNVVDDIDAKLHESAAAKHGRPLVGNRKILDREYRQFIELVELPFDDPRRYQVAGPVKEALDLHDALTETIRGYIVDSRRQLGIDTPDNWGITEKGYFRHSFLGDIRMFVDGRFHGTARTYADAQKMALDILKDHPDAKMYAEARNMAAYDPATRLSAAKYFKLVGDIGDRVAISKADLIDDLKGVIGLESRRMKFAGFLLERKGAAGYSKDYASVMKMYAAQAARTQELSKLNRALVPVIERIRSGKGTPGDQPLPGLAKEIEGHLDDLWGIPTKAEQQFGEAIRRVPILRNYVAMPDFAMRGLARKLTELNYALRLRFNIRSGAVNALQPFSTLWPYIETKEFAALYADYLRPSTREMMRVRGVLDAGTKIEGVALGAKAKNKLTGIDPFRSASAVNRGVGYLFGYRRARAAGLSDGHAHQAGLSWAERVEFDNSQWNIQPILRNPTGKVLGQFKAFQGKNYEMMANLLKEQKGDTKWTRAGRLFKWLGAQTALGGAKGLGMATKLGGGYVLAKALAEQLKGYGMSQAEADQLADAVYAGAPSLIGTDLSGSIAVFEEPYGYDLAHKMVSLIGGPTVSGLVGVGEAVQTYRESENPETKQYQAMKGAKAVTAYARPADALQQILEVGSDRVKVRLDAKNDLELTPFEAVMMVLGFTPRRQTRYYDEKNAGLAPGMAGVVKR